MADEEIEEFKKLIEEYPWRFMDEGGSFSGYTVVWVEEGEYNDSSSLYQPLYLYIETPYGRFFKVEIQEHTYDFSQNRLPWDGGVEWDPVEVKPVVETIEVVRYVEHTSLK